MILNVLLLTVCVTGVAGSFASASFSEGVKLIRGLQDQHTNVIVSPMSLYMALALLQPGLSGTQLEALRSYMGVTKTAGEWAQLFSSTNVDDAANGLKNTIANSVWANYNKINLTEAIKETLRTQYKSLLATMGPDYQATLDAMDAWISNSTNGLINKGPFAAPAQIQDLALVLINALYFKSTWTVPFDAALTELEPFFGCDGTKTDVDMMKMDTEEVVKRRVGSDGRFTYTETARSQVLRLMYGKEDRDSLDFRFYLELELPFDGDADALLASYATSPPGFRRFSQRKGLIWLPKFRIESVYLDLFTIMQAAGFPAISPYQEFASSAVQVGGIQQKTVLECDEQGTEGAAVTVIGIVTSAGPDAPPPPPPPPPFVFKAQRPFLLSVIDTESGVPLFQGKIDGFGETKQAAAGTQCTFDPAFNFQPYEPVDSSSSSKSLSMVFLFNFFLASYTLLMIF